jgi:hypothetical protein
MKNKTFQELTRAPPLEGRSQDPRPGRQAAFCVRWENGETETREILCSDASVGLVKSQKPYETT